MLKNKFETVFKEYAGSVKKQFCAHFTAYDIKIAIAKFKKGKALGSDGIFPKHVLYAGDALVYALTDLFDLCIIHGFVPFGFSSSVIVPVVKDRNDDASKCSNYRHGSLVIFFLKCWNYVFLAGAMESYLQFGFVPNKCCQKALFTLETVVNYFTDRDSPVYVASLDVSKAFDRVNHFALFIKLTD